MRLRQCDSLADKASEGVGLRQCLSVQLVYPLLWTVCRDDHQGNMLIVSLGHGRGEVQQCRTTGDTHHDGGV